MSNFDNHIYTDNRRQFMDLRNQKVANLEFDVVAIGDSITEGLNMSRFELVDYTLLNSGISGDISQLLNKRLVGDCLVFKPKIVLLMVGINDVRNFFNKMDYIYRPQTEGELKTQLVTNTLSIIEQLQTAGSKVIYTQILPINEIEKNNGYINNFIDAVNAEISSKLNEQVTVISSAHFKNKVNWLDLNLTYDGLHLNELGYQLWCQLIDQHIKQCKESGKL